MIADRLTIDIDYYISNVRLKAIRAYNELQRMDIVSNVDVYVSSSGRGLHLDAHLTDRLTDDERHTLRRFLNDDDKRVNLDIERGAVGHATDIFWTEKKGNEGERQEMTDIWAALDYLEQTRASDHSRVKAVAQHGHKGVHDNRGLNRASLAERRDA